MYENVRAISWGLILSIAYVAIIAVVAVIDPFNNGVPWVNWLTLSVVTVIAVIAATVIATEASDDTEFWGASLVTIIFWAVLGGVSSMMTTGSSNGIRPEYHPLVWTAWAVPLVVLPITVLAQYLIGAAAHRREANDSTELRRVA